MKYHNHVSKPLKLDHAFNTRDLGGYPTKDGKITKCYVFLRSGKLDALSTQDIETLYQYGVRMVLDLRSKTEVENAPIAIKNREEIEYVNIPMLDNIHSSASIEQMPASLAELYIGLLEQSQTAIQTVFKHMIAKEEGTILFNCTAGKDRTGLISMLLLKLAKVADEDILADYSASEENLMQDNLQAHLKETFNAEIPAHVLASHPAQMQQAIQHLESKYGSVYGYFKQIGLTENEIETLYHKLVS